MIDWLKIIAPFPHPEPIYGGQVMSLDADGELEWKTIKRRSVRGSYESALHIRTAMNRSAGLDFIEIDGNPAKFFQGHNLWGTDDLPGLAVATLEAVAEALGLDMPSDVRAVWETGAFELARVDIAQMFHLASRAEVLAWLRAAEQTAHLSHRGRGQLMKGSTLYFGKNSRRWGLKLYSKGEEIRAKGHKQDAILHLPSAVEYADKALRAELVLRAMELKRLGLNTMAAWIPHDGVPSGVTPELLRQRLGNLTMTTCRSLPAETLAALKPAHRAAYAAWEAGNDLREMFPRPTFYRYRKELLQHGIDIAATVPKEGTSNVVPLHRVLEAVPVGVPEWAQGTPLYFEPRPIFWRVA